MCAVDLEGMQLRRKVLHRPCLLIRLVCKHALLADQQIAKSLSCEKNWLNKGLACECEAGRVGCPCCTCADGTHLASQINGVHGAQLRGNCILQPVPHLRSAAARP